MADRLTQLAAAVWAIEEDGDIGLPKRRRLERALNEVEACLENGEPSGASNQDDTLCSVEDQVRDSDLERIREHLAATVASMRLRQQEQRHLHQLTVQKLEAVAQKCLVQERQVQHLHDELCGVKGQNKVLSQENEKLRDQIAALESESARKEVAVSAMSSAVCGLEGWIIHNSPALDRRDERPAQARTPRRVVVRGRGRFRGRYYVDDPSASPIGPGVDGASDMRLLHEGVTAWLRGFRDVEEELRIASAAGNKRSPSQEQLEHQGAESDDWGEFETAPGT